MQNCSITSILRITDIPVVICRGETVLRNPTNSADCQVSWFQRSVGPDTHSRCGYRWAPGPAGLAAAVYGASEGLDVHGAGNASAGRTSGFQLEGLRIIWDFPPEFQGNELAGRAYTQAQKIRCADVCCKRRPGNLTCERKPYADRVEMIGARISGRARYYRHGCQLSKVSA